MKVQPTYLLYPPDPLAAIGGSTSKGREGEREGWGGRGREGSPPLFADHVNHWPYCNVRREAV